jgi:succinate dehydrogenase hydrophobic anchor subunit
MLVFAWLHCTNGVRIVLDDYVRSQGWRTLLKSLLYLFGFIIIVLGAYVIFTFKA